MDGLISTEELINYIDSYNGDTYGKAWVYEIISKIPSAKIERKWIAYRCGKNTTGIYTCPFCDEGCVLSPRNYCPNCGVKLDGVTWKTI